MAINIVVANRKGGSGKTTTSVNIADGLSRKGQRVLLVDADSQAQATISCGVLPHSLDMTLYQLMQVAMHESDSKSAIGSAILRKVKSFDFIPSRPDLSAIEIEAAQFPGRESLLKDILLRLDREYDFIIIDLPPSLGLITINGLVAANKLLIPVEPSFLSMDGLAQMMSILYRVNADLNPDLRLLGILPIKCDLRTNLARSVVDEIKKNFGPDLLLPAIRNDVKLAEAPSFGKTIFEYAASCRGAQDYTNLVKKIYILSGESNGR
ncbi:MAG: ParA family protein [Chitinophagales bacterium]